MNNDLISNRVVNQLGISVATAIALETLFDIDVFDKERERPKIVKPEIYGVNMFNIFTLFRNVLGSIKYKNKDELVNNRGVKDQLINDMYLIMTLYNDIDTDLVFYLPDYSSVYRRYNTGKGKNVYTPYATHKFIYENIKRLKFPGNVLHGGTAGILTRDTRKTLLLTHFTFDLLNITSIPNLALLESHTGRIKNKVEWGTKYHPIGKRDLSSLPIDNKLLYIVGDKTLVRPFPIKDRVALYELIVVNNWTPATAKITINKLINRFNNRIPV